MPLRTSGLQPDAINHSATLSSTTIYWCAGLDLHQQGPLGREIYSLRGLLMPNRRTTKTTQNHRPAQRVDLDIGENMARGLVRHHPLRTRLSRIRQNASRLKRGYNAYRYDGPCCSCQYLCTSVFLVSTFYFQTVIEFSGTPSLRIFASISRAFLARVHPVA
jgi:hypothetical protein